MWLWTDRRTCTQTGRQMSRQMVVTSGMTRVGDGVGWGKGGLRENSLQMEFFDLAVTGRSAVM